MFKNYLITAYRNIKKNVSHTIINVIGLGIGLACVLTVFALIYFEYSFDNWHAQKDQVYRVGRVYYGDYGLSHHGIISYPHGKVLREEFPEIKKVVEFHGPKDDRISIIDNEGNFQIYRENDVLMTNSSFFEVLDFKIVKGNKDEFAQPNKAFLSESTARKYFKDADPIGKTIKLDNELSIDVIGVVEDSRKNTNLPYNVLISMETLQKRQPRIWQLWNMTWAYSAYVQVEKGTDITQLSIKIDQVVDKYANPEKPEIWEKTKINLQPLETIHTDEKYGDGQHYVTPSLIVYTFIFLAALVLITAILNFVNLNTAIAVKRSKEVGVRKTLGSSKSQLITQFLTETFLIVVLSMLLAFFISQILLDGFNNTLTIISYDLKITSEVIVFSVFTGLAITVLAGFYPSIILSGYQPAEAIKNSISIKKGSGSFNIRRTLIVAQFFLTSLLIISALIISEQMNYAKNRDFGFDPHNVVLISTPSESKKDPKGFLNIMQAKSYVSGGCLAFGAPMSYNNWNNQYKLPGTDEVDGHNANMKFIDKGYVDFYDIELVAGRNINEREINDSTYQVLVNKRLVDSMGWKSSDEALGKTLRVNNDQMEIIGIVKDFNIYGANRDLKPVMLYYEKEQLKEVALRIPTNELHLHLSDIQNAFTAYYPNELFEFEILKHQMDDVYIIENLLMNVIQIVAFLAIILSAMGLYGLVSYMANRSAKVIGIRKVFGATTSNILQIFTKEYLKLMLVAFVVAGPATYFLISIWMDEFVYRIAISPKFFIFGFLLTAIITLLTVGYRSYLAAKVNPVKSLKYE